MIEAPIGLCSKQAEGASFLESLSLPSLLGELELTLRRGRSRLLAGDLLKIERITDEQLALLHRIGNLLRSGFDVGSDRSHAEPETGTVKSRTRALLAEARLQEHLLRRLQHRLETLSRASLDRTAGYSEAARVRALQGDQLDGRRS